MSIKSIICNKKRCHVTHVNSPAQLVFGQDMFMPVSANVDFCNWDAIKQRKQNSIHKSNECENLSQINHIYSSGDCVREQKGIGKVRYFCARDFERAIILI